MSPDLNLSTLWLITAGMYAILRVGFMSSWIGRQCANAYYSMWCFLNTEILLERCLISLRLIKVLLILTAIVWSLSYLVGGGIVGASGVMLSFVLFLNSAMWINKDEIIPEHAALMEKFKRERLPIPKSAFFSLKRPN